MATRASNAGVVVLAGCRGDATQPSRTDPVVEPPLVDLAKVSHCVVRCECGMSHPGLGTWSRTSIDLRTCERTTASSSAPYEAQPVVPSTEPVDAPSKPAPQHPSACKRIAGVAASITKTEASHHESAPVDTQACTVELERGGTRMFAVQRQTTIRDRELRR